MKAGRTDSAATAAAARAATADMDASGRCRRRCWQRGAATPPLLLLLLVMLLHAGRAQVRYADSLDTCEYYTSRYFHIEASPDDPLTINVRQNVKGYVRVVEQPRDLIGSLPGQITVLINWTSNSAALLDTVESEWTTFDTLTGRMVTIQLDADSPQQVKTNTAPIIIGSSVAGGVIVLSIFAIIVVVAIKKNDCCSKESKKTLTEDASAAARAIAMKNQTSEADEYDGTIYPDSIFGTQHDNASHDASTLNLSLLLADQAPEGHGYRYTAGNAFADQASEYSIPSLPRHSAKSTTPQPEQMALLPLAQSPWRRTHPYGRHMTTNLDYTRPSGPIPVLPPTSPQLGSPGICRPPSADEPANRAGPQPHLVPPRLSSFSQLPSLSNGSSGPVVAKSLTMPSAQPRARRLQQLVPRAFAFPPLPPSPLTVSGSEEDDGEAERATVYSEEQTDSDGYRDDDDELSSVAVAAATEGLPPVLAVPKEFMSNEETIRGSVAMTTGSAPLVAALEAKRPQAASRERMATAHRSLLPTPVLHASLVALTVVSVFTGSGLTFCNSKPLANVIFFVPKDVNIAAIKLFANKELRPSFIENSWYVENKALFQVYDVADAGLSPNKPCSTRYECPSANASLVECDLGSQKCACIRGYNINSRFACEDVDECRNGGDDVCPPGTSCRNTPGSYACLCPAGQYWSGIACIACSIGCPENQFEVKSCAPTSDRLCSACRKCPSGTYTFRPCSARLDTTCMHISRPNVFPQDQPATLIRDKVKLITSPNVFAEDLLPMPTVLGGATAPLLLSPSFGNLEQTVYVGDNSQRMSFTWQRPSGVRIFVELAEFGLVPQYESVQHSTDDNQYLRRLRDDPSQRSTYEAYLNVQENYCSQPIPDYYNLMLKHYRGRLTAVELVTCNVDKKNCPANYQNGQTYVRRLANRPCPKESKPPESVPDSGNSLLCMEPTTLLTRIFPQAAATFAKDEALHFPPADCTEQMVACKNCLLQKCQDQESSCCAASCHGTPECKNTTSASCTNFQIECATGDLAQFILQANFSRSEFRCNVKRLTPERLVRISYHAIAPHGWNSSRQVVDVPAASDFMGSTTAAFFSVKYSTSLDAPGGAALLRGLLPLSDSSGYSFSILSRRTSSLTTTAAVGNQRRPARPPSSQFAKDVWIARVQSAQPFLISTPTWRTTHGCGMDVGSPASSIFLLPPDDQERRELDLQSYAATPVELSAKRQANQFTYTVKTRSMPWLRLSLPGNQSVLQHLFDRPTIDRKSVNVELVSSASQSDSSDMWELLVTGQVSECGGYVGVTVTDRTALTVIARYDCLVSCPDRSRQPAFSLRIMIPVPPPSLDPAIGHGSQNKLLQVDVSDAVGSTSHFVTTYMGLVQPEQLPAGGLAQEPSRNVDNRSEAESQQSAVHIGTIALAVAVAISFAYALLWLGCLRRSKPRKLSRLPPLLPPAASAWTPTQPSQVKTTSCRSTSKPRKIALIVVFCLYKLAYSVTFSCTALFFLTSALSGRSVEVLQSTLVAHQSIMRDVASDLRSVTAWGVSEIERQQAAFDERMAACTEYAVSKRRELSTRVTTMMMNTATSKTTLEEVKLESLMAKVVAYQRRTVDLLSSYRRNATRRVTDLFFVYNGFLDEIFSNDWLKVARLNFQSALMVEQLLNRNSTRGEFLQFEKAAFLGFLGSDRPSSAAKRVESVLRRSEKVAELAEAGFTEAVLSSFPEGLHSTAIYRKLLSRPGVSFSAQRVPYKAAELTTPTVSRSLTVFQAVLAVIDVLLFLYRLMSAAKTVRALSGGFVREDRGDSSDSSNSGRTPADEKAARVMRQELDMIRSQITLTRRPPPGAADGSANVDSPVARNTQLRLPPTAAACRSCVRALRGRVGCRVAVWLASVAVLLLVAAALDQLLTRRAVLRSTAIDRLAGSVTAYSWASEAYARAYAASLTRSADATMRRELNPTLHYLLRHDALHESEMSWFLRLYQTRRCSVTGFVGSGCDFDVTSNSSVSTSNVIVSSTGQARIDITPCQALPITARRLPGSLLKINAASLSMEFRKYSNALRDVTLTTVGMVLLFVNLVVILHLTELLAIKIVQARRWTHRLGVKVLVNLSGQVSSQDELPDGPDTATANVSEGDSRVQSPETMSVLSGAKSERSEHRSTLTSAVAASGSAARSPLPSHLVGRTSSASRSDDSRRRPPKREMTSVDAVSHASSMPRSLDAQRPLPLSPPISRARAMSSQSSGASASGSSRTPTQLT